MSSQTHRTRIFRLAVRGSAAAAIIGTATYGQSSAFLDLSLTNGASIASVAPGQGFPVTVSVRSTAPLEFNAAQFLVYCTEEGLQLDDYAWSPPFITGGPGDFSLGGAALPLVIYSDTLQGPTYPTETPDIEFAMFDFVQSAGEGQLLRLWVRAPKLPPGSVCFMGALPDLFTDGFQVVPVNPGVPLRIEISATANAGDVDGDGVVGSSDLSALLSSWAMTSPVGQADGDLDADGDVDAEDLAILLVNWG